MEHMGENLLEGERLSDQPAQRHGFDELVLMEHLHAAQRGIQLQDDVMTDQVSRDRVSLEIEADHAVPIHFALHMQPIQWREPAIRIHRRWQWR